MVPTVAARVLEEIRESACAIDDLEINFAHGIYGVVVAKPLDLLGARHRPGEVLYVGASHRSAARVFAMHFRSNQTGRSTVRRSLVAILKAELKLMACARGRGGSKADFANYKFEARGEDRLTGWMKNHLHIGAAKIRDPFDVEPGVIALSHPLLNLKGWENPSGREIRALRAVCAVEAGKGRSGGAG